MCVFCAWDPCFCLCLHSISWSTTEVTLMPPSMALSEYWTIRSYRVQFLEWTPGPLNEHDLGLFYLFSKWKWGYWSWFPGLLGQKLKWRKKEGGSRKHHRDQALLSSAPGSFPCISWLTLPAFLPSSPCAVQLLWAGLLLWVGLAF